MLLRQRSSRLAAVGSSVRVLAAALPLSLVLPSAVPPVFNASGDAAAIGEPRSEPVWLAAARAEGPGKPTKERYTCPMHPHYIAEHAGTCPICGMDLVKLGPSASPGASAESRQVVTIAPEVVQNMGVRIAPAERARFGQSVRATAMVMENERTRSVLTARVEGWVEELKVTAVGDPVSKGQKLFELYAPELVVSQRDYLAAMRERDTRRLQDTETRLRAFGLQDQAMTQLAAQGREMQRVPFYADRDGVISDLAVVNGEYLKRGATVLRVQDYSTVWLVVNVAEKDLAFIGSGARATVTVPGLPGRTFTPRVDYVYPTIDVKTRTGRVRLVVENSDGAIRPGSFADVAFEIDAEPRLAVKSEAVLTSERGAFVVVAIGEGRFEPRLVETGLVSGGWTEVRQGVTVGEKIVVSGQFLIDSESALSESFRKLERMQMPLSLLALSKAELAMIDHMVDAALYLHEAIVDGYEVEPRFLQPAREIRDLLWPQYGKTRLAVVLDDAAAAIGAAQGALSDSETKAALAGLVEAIKPWMTEGAPRHYGEKNVHLLEDRESGRRWIQRADLPTNPYGKGDAKVIPWLSPTGNTGTPGPATTGEGQTGHVQPRQVSPSRGG